MTKKIVNIFVDFSHVWMSLQEMKGKGLNSGRLSFRELHESIISNRVMGPYCAVYSSIPPEGQQAFFSGESAETFRELRYKEVALPLKQKEMSCHRCGNSWQAFSEKTVDAALITGMFVAAINMTPDMSIALVSGDGDFLPATRAIMDMGIPVEIWGFRNHTTRRIRFDRSVQFRPLDSFIAC